MNTHRLTRGIILLLVACVAAPAVADDSTKEERWQNRAEALFQRFLEDWGEALQKALRDWEKADKEAAKAAEKAREEDEKVRKEEDPDKRAEKLRKLEEKRLEEHLKALAKLGKLNPTTLAILDSDFDAASVANQDAAFRIEAQAAHQVATGRGIVVAVLDGGFNLRHPMLRDRIAPYAYDALELDFDPQDPGNGFDDDWDGEPDLGVGHGTFVAGMILLAAPDAVILPVRIADDEGRGSEEQIAAGLEFAIDMGVDVINLSLEAGTKDHDICHLLDRARKEGIVVVTSAGNGGAMELGELAEEDFTIAVGAVDGMDGVAEFTNEPGEKQRLTVYAPGVNLWGPYGWPYEESMCLWSGTSFAAGLVTGGAALILERHPEFTAEQVMATLSQAVDAVFSPTGLPVPGAGRLNLRKAVER